MGDLKTKTRHALKNIDSLLRVALEEPFAVWKVDH